MPKQCVVSCALNVTMSQLCAAKRTPRLYTDHWTRSAADAVREVELLQHHSLCKTSHAVHLPNEDKHAPAFGSQIYLSWDTTVMVILRMPAWT